MRLASVFRSACVCVFVRPTSAASCVLGLLFVRLGSALRASCVPVLVRLGSALRASASSCVLGLLFVRLTYALRAYYVCYTSFVLQALRRCWHFPATVIANIRRINILYHQHYKRFVIPEKIFRRIENYIPYNKKWQNGGASTFWPCFHAHLALMRTQTWLKICQHPHFTIFMGDLLTSTFGHRIFLLFSMFFCASFSRTFLAFLYLIGSIIDHFLITLFLR